MHRPVPDPAMAPACSSTLALLPPVIVIISMQRWFVKGLVDPEK